MSSEIQFIVITKLSSDDEGGNKADDFLFPRKFKTGVGPEGDIIEELYTDIEKPTDEDYKRVLRARLSVFALGEILIVNRNGREIAGLGRKPSKWLIEYKTFDRLDDAIKCAEELIDP